MSYGLCQQFHFILTGLHLLLSQQLPLLQLQLQLWRLLLYLQALLCNILFYVIIGMHFLLFLKCLHFEDAIIFQFQFFLLKYPIWHNFVEAGQCLMCMGRLHPILLLEATWKEWFNKSLTWVEEAGIGILLSVLFVLLSTILKELLTTCIQYVKFRWFFSYLMIFVYFIFQWQLFFSVWLWCNFDGSLLLY